MSLEKTAATEAFWKEFTVARGDIATDYIVVALGDNTEMASRLATLVLSGKKRATASLLRDYERGSDPLPRPGDFVLVVDGRGHPKCIWRTTEVRVKTLIEVDDDLAWDEGEGDRTRDWWLAAHREYFTAQARREGFEMHDTIETVFERFEVVWPP